MSKKKEKIATIWFKLRWLFPSFVSNILCVIWFKDTSMSVSLQSWHKESIVEMIIIYCSIFFSPVVVFARTGQFGLKVGFIQWKLRRMFLGFVSFIVLNMSVCEYNYSFESQPQRSDNNLLIHFFSMLHLLLNFSSPAHLSPHCFHTLTTFTPLCCQCERQCNLPAIVLFDKGKVLVAVGNSFSQSTRCLVL